MVSKRSIKCWGECEKNALLVECKLLKSLWQVVVVWIFLEKLKIELSYDPTIPLLAIYLKKVKTLT